MQIKKIRYLNQMNRWATHQLIEITVECTASLHAESLLLTFFNEYFPEYHLVIANCSSAEFIEKLLVSLLGIIGCTAKNSCIKQIQNQTNLFYVLIEYDLLETAESITQFALDILENDHKNKLLDYKKRLDLIKNRYEDIRVGPSTLHILQAAVRKNIPVRRIGTGSLLQLGHGHKQRRIQASLIDSTSSIADAIVQDKFLTKKALQVLGIPTPKGYVVSHESSASYDADEIGYPIVVKPLDGNQGKGVFVNLKDEQELTLAFRSAKKYGSDILLEQYIVGDDYRLLVVGEQLVAAAKRVPPQITGDGVQTISQLIEELNQDCRRLDAHNGYLSKITVDDIVLATLNQQGLCLDNIPQVNQNILLRQNSNLSTGGHAIDVTDLVHPSIVKQAIIAANSLNIDVCGIDLVCKDITQPLVDGNGCFIELNLAPGLRMHIAPSFGQARDVGTAIIEHMFKGDNARIPIITITGTNGKTTCTRLLSQLLQDYKFQVGMTCTDGIYFNQDKIYSGDCTGPWSAESILSHPDVEVCVLETARGGILRQGLGFNTAEIAIITNIGQADHLGLDYINTPNDIAEIKQTILKSLSATGTAILNGDDSLITTMASHIQSNIIYFSTQENNPVLKRHHNNGGAIIYFDINKSNILLKQKNECYEFNIQDIGSILNTQAIFQIQNTMCVVASIWALKLPMENLSLYLSRIQSNKCAGRFNMYNHSGRTIIADYAHNLDAIHAIIRTIHSIPATRRLVLTSSAGDRQDHIIIQQMKLLADHFDHGIIYQDLCQRGRQPGEVQLLIREGFAQGGRLSSVHEIHNEKQAIEHILNITMAGELCLLLIDDVDNSINTIRHNLQICDSISS